LAELTDPHNPAGREFHLARNHKSLHVSIWALVYKPYAHMLKSAFALI
jgi:hypothetical protein